MRHIRLLCLGLLGLCVAAPVAARNDVYHLSIVQAIKSPEANGRFDNFVLLFGDQPASGYTTLGEHVATERSHFHGRAEEQACQANFLENVPLADSDFKFAPPPGVEMVETNDLGGE